MPSRLRIVRADGTVISEGEPSLVVDEEARRKELLLTRAMVFRLKAMRLLDKWNRRFPVKSREDSL